jgi:prepilin-type N-terminal cleavage/methylation domain-containing protein
MDKLKRLMRDLHLRDEDGFTLVELMVVLVVMATLLLMATSTFIGVKQRAQNGAARAAAAQTVTTARVIFTDNAKYTDVTAASMVAAEPNFTFVANDTASTDTKHPSVYGQAINTFVASVWSASGNCFFIREQVLTGIDVAKVTMANNTNCSATWGYTPGNVTFSKVW